MVAMLAAVFLRERFSRGIPLALVVLAVGLALGLRIGDVRVDSGVRLLITSTMLFAIGAVLTKLALRTVSVAMIVTVKMALGAVLLFAYVAATGGLTAVLGLSSVQWGFVLLGGLLVLASTLTTITGLHHASATGVTAVEAGAPILTATIVGLTRHVPIHPVQLLGMGLVLAAVLTVYVLGAAEESRRAAS
jgi:drug/metabolite transporter (DMT)-like permease